MMFRQNASRKKDNDTRFPHHFDDLIAPAINQVDSAA